MTLNKVWVFGEATDGKVATITLEMLAKAREIADTVEVVYGGADADAIAATLGEHGASAVLATGDLGGGLPGVAVASAIAEAVKVYRSAVAANTRPYTKNRRTADDKNRTRAVAERLIRDAGNLIRASRQVDSSTKDILRITTRPARLRRHGKPVTAPELSFVGRGPMPNRINGTHVLRFRDPTARVGSMKPKEVVKMRPWPWLASWEMTRSASAPSGTFST